MKKTILTFIALCTMHFAFCIQPEAIPTFGQVDMIELPALQVLHSDGDWTTDPVLVGEETTSHEGYTLTCRTYRDDKHAFTLRQYIKTYTAVAMTETWTEIEHRQKKAVTLKRFDSGYFTLPRGNVYIMHLHGTWAAEAVPTIEPLTPGLKAIRNTDGARNAHCDAPEMMISLDGMPRENEGQVIGMALCWSGNYELRVNTNNNRTHQFYAGIDPQSSEYVLEPGEVFTTPHLALTYSEEGLSGASRNFHRWARTQGMMHDGMGTRRILLNSWEGVYFDIDEERMHNMMADIAGMGGELFVMDDGWFGGKYPRNNDSSSLGDWVIDTRKLPNGIDGLLAEAKRQGIRFGIWVEPEGINTVSELYEKHPDWCLRVPGRELRLGRGGTQLVLDMCNPKVQDFVFNMIDDLLSRYPEIAYIKWDANNSIQNYGSPYLPKNKQSHIYIDYHRGLVKTLARIRAKYPDVCIQNCASGGGRANYGLMPYFDEFWVSDNNDALQRVYIQYGTSLFFPANAMAQHIGGSPYHMTGRVLPIKFRCDVAMSGRLGMELQPRNMSDEERQQCSVAIGDYKRLRNLIQLGNLYRLVSPYDKQGISSLMYTSDSKDSAIVFVYKLEHLMNQTLPYVRMAGLDPEARYVLEEVNVKNGSEACALSGKVYTGRELMTTGLLIPLDGEYASRVFLLRKQAILFGHQDDTAYGHDWHYQSGRSDCKDITGHYPAIIGFDLGHIETGDSVNLDGVPFAYMCQAIRDQIARGGTVSLSWHMRNPLTGGDAWDNSSRDVVRSILPGGTNHAAFCSALDKVANFISSIINHQSSIIFRPWHENSGSWFWWGSTCCTPEEYIALYRFTHEYLDRKGLTGLRYAYSPNLGVTSEQFLATYPGADYVDLLGVDVYHMDEPASQFQTNLNASLSLLTDMGRKLCKPIALTETGQESVRTPHWWTEVLYPVIVRYPIEYVLIWRNAWDRPSHYYMPYPGQTTADDFLKFTDKNDIILL